MRGEMGKIQKRILVSLIFILISGCSFHPSTKDVNDFGKTAVVAVEAVSDGVRLANDLSLNAAIQRNSCKYLQHQRFRLSTPPDKITVEAVAEQEKFLIALAKYADALSKSVDEESVSKLRSAAKNLAEAIGGVASAIPAAPPASAVVGPAAKVALNLVVNISELQRRQEIRGIVAGVHDNLFDGVDLILSDAETIREDLLESLAVWEREVRCNLRKSRGNKPVAKKLFEEFDTQKRAYLSRIETLDEGVVAMAAMLAAHKKLADGKGDHKEAIEQFDAVIADLISLRKSLSTL